MEKGIEREIRLYILILVCFVSYLIYWFFSISVVIPGYCAGISAYWLYDDNYWSPFWMFATLFSLILLWSITELISAFILKEDRVFTLSVFCVVFIFLAFFFAGHYTLWQIIGIQNETDSVENFMFTYGYFDFLKDSDRTHIPSIDAYLKRESCKKGIEVFNLSEEDRRFLLHQYFQSFK